MTSITLAPTPAQAANLAAQDLLAARMAIEGRLSVETHRFRTLPKPRHEVEADIVAVIRNSEHGIMTAPAVSEHLGKSRSFAHVHLVRMAEEGRLVGTAIASGKARIFLYELGK